MPADDPCDVIPYGRTREETSGSRRCVATRRGIGKFKCHEWRSDQFLVRGLNRRWEGVCIRAKNLDVLRPQHLVFSFWIDARVQERKVIIRRAAGHGRISRA